jgi:glycosyltransferase involved in cell wall biosynthesis
MTVKRHRRTPVSELNLAATSSSITVPGESPNVLLINAFERLPGENFRDQRYTFLYELLKQRASVTWFSSDFHHWSHSRRSVEMIPAEDRPNIKLIRTLGYQRNVSIRRFVSYMALSVATLWNILKQPRRPNVIVCMGPVEQMFLVVVYGRIRRVPVIIDVIDPWPDVYVQAFPRRLQWLGRLILIPYFLMSFLTFALCDRGSAVSQTYLEWAMRRGRRNDRGSFARYYLGARNADFEINEVVQSPESLTCLFAGQFGFSYDIELILNAAKALQDSGETRIRFVLCGSGDKQAEIVRAIKTLGNVELHGWLSAEALNTIGNSCQVGLCCYRASATQSVPTKVFDYLSMGLYVINSLAGEAETLLEVHGIGSSYQAGDVASFVQCLQRVRCSIELGRAGRAAIRRTFDEHFDSRVIYNRMVDEFVLPLALQQRQV